MLLGLVQLEALESLNSVSEQKVRRFMEMLTKDTAAEALKSELLQIRQVFDSVQASRDDGLLLFLYRYMIATFLAVNLQIRIQN